MEMSPAVLAISPATENVVMVAIFCPGAARTEIQIWGVSGFQSLILTVFGSLRYRNCLSWSGKASFECFEAALIASSASFAGF